MLDGYERARTDVMTRWRIDRVLETMNARSKRRIGRSSLIRQLLIDGLAEAEERLSLPPFLQAYRKKNADRSS